MNRNEYEKEIVYRRKQYDMAKEAKDRSAMDYWAASEMWFVNRYGEEQDNYAMNSYEIRKYTGVK